MSEAPKVGGGENSFSELRLIGRATVALGLSGIVDVGVNVRNSISGVVEYTQERLQAVRDVACAVGELLHADPSVVCPPETPPEPEAPQATEVEPSAT